MEKSVRTRKLSVVFDGHDKPIDITVPFEYAQVFGVCGLGPATCEKCYRVSFVEADPLHFLVEFADGFSIVSSLVLESRLIFRKVSEVRFYLGGKRFAIHA